MAGSIRSWLHWDSAVGTYTGDLAEFEILVVDTISKYRYLLVGPAIRGAGYLGEAIS